MSSLGRGDHGGSMAARAGLVTGMLMLIAACSSAPPFEPPASVDDGFLRERAVTKIEDDIRVSAAIASVDEARSIMGVDLEERGIQPLWLEIENGSDRPFYFLPAGLDPEYFAPLELAFLYEGSFADYRALGEHLEAVGFDHRSPIPPGATTTGFVYTYVANPTMMTEIDLIGREWSKRVTFLLPVPGTEAGQEALAAVSRLYARTGFVELDDDATLRTALEELPCCVTDETGVDPSLPLNLVLIGDIEEWGPLFVGRSYRYTPVSPWYALGRVQDASGRKVGRWVSPQPHTLRVWLTPLRYRGRPVWVAQVSSDLGGRFATQGEGARPVEPAVDEARNDLVQDLFYSQGLTKIGFVEAMDPVAATEPRQTPDGSTYHTDGLRAVMAFGDEAVALDEIDFFDWERLVDHREQRIDAPAAP